MLEDASSNSKTRVTDGFSYSFQKYSEGVGDVEALVYRGMLILRRNYSDLIVQTVLPA